MLLYEDDMVMYHCNNNARTVEEVLSIEFEKVLNWLSFKLNKAENLNLSANTITINTSEVYEYLGTSLDQLLTFKPHVEKVCKKSSSRVKLLSRTRKEICPHTTESIYKAMIEP